MKIILYEYNNVLKVYEGITNPQKTDKGVKWDQGEFEFNSSFIIVSDDNELKEGDGISDELIQSYNVEVDPTEIEELKKQLAETNALLLDLLESFYGGA